MRPFISKRKNKPDKIQEKMKAQLSGSRFRWLNELLYTRTGQEAFELFQQQPDMFQAYHEGFSEQVKEWPENPLDRIIGHIQNVLDKSTPSAKVETICDMGCGEARLATTLRDRYSKNAIDQIYSFDLISRNESIVTACDITKVPLASESVTIIVYCLSLMNTNWLASLEEGIRILKAGYAYHHPYNRIHS